MNKLIETLRLDLNEDLEFFGYSMITIKSEEGLKLIFAPNNNDAESSSFEVLGWLKLYLAEQNHNFSAEENGPILMVFIERDNKKSLDGVFSEIDIDLKSEDNAINTSGAVMSKIVNRLNKLIQDIGRVVSDQELDDLDLAIDLSQSSPFRKLSAEELTNKDIVDKIWNNLPKFMYFPHELKAYQDEYDDILEAIIVAKELKFVELLKNIRAELNKLDEKDEDLSSQLGQLKKTVTEATKKYEVQDYSSKYNNARTINQMQTAIEAIIKELEVKN